MKGSSERFPDFEDVTGLNFSSFYLLLGQGDVQLTPRS